MATNRNQEASKTIWGFDKSIAVSPDPAVATEHPAVVAVRELETALKKIPGGVSNAGLANHTNLAIGANRAYESPSFAAPSKSRPFAQKNRNFGPGSLGESNSLDPAPLGPKGGEGVEEALDEATKAKKAADVLMSAKANCSKHNHQQGATHCKYCRGLGFKKAFELEKRQQEGIQPNQPRHYGPGGKQLGV